MGNLSPRITRLKARPLLSPKLFQAICHGTPGVIPLRTTKVSFCNGIPGSPIFPVPPKVGHLTAFVGMPTKFVRKIHERPRARVFEEIRDRPKGSCLFGEIILTEYGVEFPRRGGIALWPPFETPAARAPQGEVDMIRISQSLN